MIACRIRRRPRLLPASADLVTDGLRITIEGADAARVRWLAREVRSLLAQHQAAREMRAWQGRAERLGADGLAGVA